MSSVEFAIEYVGLKNVKIVHKSNSNDVQSSFIQVID